LLWFLVGWVFFIRDSPDMGAMVVVCTNMPPYAGDNPREPGGPVFDITTLVRMAHDAFAGGRPPRPA
jgi:hypothetical protein